MYKQLLFILFIVAFCGKDVLCNRHKLKRSVGGDERIVGGDNRIVGGDDVTIQSYPYMAFLYLYNGTSYFKCGGVIVSEEFILTAAHCLKGKVNMTVRIGSRNKERGGLEYETDKFDSHPLYNPTTLDYDVGVVQVNGMALDGENARAISLIEPSSDVPDGKKVVVTGWGFTSPNGTRTTTLKKVDLFAVERNRCNKILGGRKLTTRMFCAGLAEDGKGACQGDSGGPAAIDNKLAGLTSFGRGKCGRPNNPGVYTFLGNENIRSFIRMKTGLSI